MLSAHQVGGRADGLKMLLLYSGPLLERELLQQSAAMAVEMRSGLEPGICL